MKIITIIGARPQFVKAAVVSRELRKFAEEIIVHTGQHYDNNMSQVFFDELKIPKPVYNLGIGSGRHGAQTGAMLSAIEDLCLKVQPDRMLVYGDTNSTLAGTLAAAKLSIPVAHIEAGLRSFNREMPEEINRVMTDHISDLLFCPSQVAVDNLANEGLKKGVYLTGDVMYEALMRTVDIAEKRSLILSEIGLKKNKYALVTIHRPENTDYPEKLRNIIEALVEVSNFLSVIFPIHPRTKKKMQEYELIGMLENMNNLILLEPVGYLDMVELEAAAKVILTDSGGIQKEAYWLKVPCVTIRQETEWVETVEQGWNVVTGANRDLIINYANLSKKPDNQVDAYWGDGSVKRIVEQLQ
ncbi:UDP-N-acetylglucosamine 2-epimerase (non-hydrolyzing) [bacterium]|nr:UDP-N-acetylglucosamine 2-epimerase (non-hydrolyzing) [bacterium]